MVKSSKLPLAQISGINWFKKHCSTISILTAFFGKKNDPFYAEIVTITFCF